MIIDLLEKQIINEISEGYGVLCKEIQKSLNKILNMAISNAEALENSLREQLQLVRGELQELGNVLAKKESFQSIAHSNPKEKSSSKRRRRSDLDDFVVPDDEADEEHMGRNGSMERFNVDGNVEDGNIDSMTDDADDFDFKKRTRKSKKSNIDSNDESNDYESIDPKEDFTDPNFPIGFKVSQKDFLRNRK